MEFIRFRDQVKAQFEKMSEGATHLFEAAIDKDVLWNLYLDSYPAGTNEIFRERREHDCSCCRNFIRAIGGTVAIKDNKVITLWDVETGSTTYQPVVDALATYVRSKAINNVFIGESANIGTEKNFEETPEKIYQWNHLYLVLPERFVRNRHKSIGEQQGEFKATKDVFKRSLEEITVESVEIVLELIEQNSLYKGEEWKAALKSFLEYKKAYDKLKTNKQKDLYAWEQSISINIAVSRIRNHSIGTLLVNLSEGMDLDLAVKKYESIVAPSNYKRPKAIFTQKMLEDAKKKITELGYMDSLPRRHATLDDITVNNILFSNKDSAKRMGLDIFDEMSKEVAINPKKFSKVEEITITDFIGNVLPNAKEVELLLENKHKANMVSLIAPVNKDSQTMFKWNNGFSWAYSGNITDSEMKTNVKNAGGNVDGVLRFSIQWNDEVRESCDLDAHCLEPNGYEIYFRNKTMLSTTGGVLDVDIITPELNVAAVENITWASKEKMVDGEYVFGIHIFSGSLRGTVKAEIEFDGEIHSFEAKASQFNKGGDYLKVAKVIVKDGEFTLKPLIDCSSAIHSKDVWGVKTQQFIPVSVVMNSPNYWDEQEGIGHKHYFFMLKDCVNPEQPNGFYNEFLKNELNEHKRVFEALGGKMAVQEVEDQLSGVGFSSTKRNDVIVKVKGATERILKVKF